MCAAATLQQHQRHRRHQQDVGGLVAWQRRRACGAGVKLELRDDRAADEGTGSMPST